MDKSVDHVGTSDLFGRVAGLFVYPLKGGQGIAMDRAELEPRGIRHDRRWMITSPGGRFLTQRELPELATIETFLEGDVLQLRFGGRQLALPFDDRGEPVEVRVWRDEVTAVRPDPAFDRALAAHLGREVMLVRLPDGARRACDPAFAAAAETAFADGYPILVTTTGSLDELNGAIMERGGDPVPMARFRPNVVVADVPARAEDLCSAIELEGGAELLLVKPCERCIVTTTDQTTGERPSGEPIESLRRIRRDPATGEVRFGQNAVPLLGDSARRAISVGQSVRLVARRQERGCRGDDRSAT